MKMKLQRSTSLPLITLNKDVSRLSQWNASNRMIAYWSCSHSFNQNFIALIYMYSLTSSLSMLKQKRRIGKIALLLSITEGINPYNFLISCLFLISMNNRISILYKLIKKCSNQNQERKNEQENQSPQIIPNHLIRKNRKKGGSNTIVISYINNSKQYKTHSIKQRSV